MRTKLFNIIVCLLIPTSFVSSCGSEAPTSAVKEPVSNAQPVSNVQPAKQTPEEIEWKIAGGLLQLITISNWKASKSRFGAKEMGLNQPGLFFAEKPSSVKGAPKVKALHTNSKVTNIGTVMNSIKNIAVAKKQTIKLTWSDAEGDEHYLTFVATKISKGNNIELHLVMEELYLSYPNFGSFNDSSFEVALEDINMYRTDYGKRTIWIFFVIDAAGNYSDFRDPSDKRILSLP